MTMDSQQWIPWWLFSQLPGLGPRRAEALLEIYPHPQQLFSANDLSPLPASLQNTIKALQDQGDAHPWHQAANAMAEKAQALNVQIIARDTEHYPAQLSAIHSAPYLLFVKGCVQSLHNPQLAVVGARKASPLAMQISKDWSCALAKAGITITSGLALGIDAAAHMGALAGGTTIAVLAHGMDQVYPRQHQYLADQICAQGGAVLSEFDFGEQPRREYFPQRNRLISGLSMGVLVVEAALKSGSLITARFAMEQNREVFAVPGSINNVMARGCHHLIKQGAQLVENCDDILQSLALPISHAMDERETRKVDEESNTHPILSVMQDVPLHINELQLKTGLTTAQLASELMLLELDGKLAVMNGYYQKLV